MAVRFEKCVLQWFQSPKDATNIGMGLAGVLATMRTCEVNSGRISL